MGQGKECIVFHDHRPPMGSGKRIRVCRGDKFTFATHGGWAGRFTLTGVSRDGKVRMKQAKTGAVRRVSIETFMDGLFPADKKKYASRG